MGEDTFLDQGLAQGQGQAVGPSTSGDASLTPDPVRPQRRESLFHCNDSGGTSVDDALGRKAMDGDMQVHD